ncbi:MAG: ATP-binding protein [Xanthobacteraceae bacterium]
MMSETCVDGAETIGRAGQTSLEELLTFERLLVDLSARFANVSGDRIETEIESALRRLLEFLDFDRGNFGEFNVDGWAVILCSVVKGVVERYSPGRAPPFLNWYNGQLRAEKILHVRSINDLPPEAAGEREYYRRSGIRTSVGIPLRVGGRVVGFINFSAFRPTRQWPDSLIARLKIVGEVMAQAHVRRRSEAALQAAQLTLVRMTRLTTMHAVAASIAHEVNQPLAAIVANGNAAMRFLAFETPNLDDARTAVNSIVVDGHRASEVIESIRAMFKTIDQEQAPLDINKLVHDVLALMKVQWQEVLVQTQLNAQPPDVIGSRVQLQQVVLNLIVNALDAMNSVIDRPRVLRLRSEIHNPDSVLLSVEDSGTGIDPNNVDRIFDAFFTTKSQGMGIGLSLCRSIIESHRGRLWVSSSSDRGSVFNVLLPAINVSVQ